MVINSVAIYVLKSTKVFGGVRPKALIGTMERRIKLGPVDGGRMWAEIQFLGERHWVHKRIFDQIRAADDEMGV